MALEIISGSINNVKIQQPSEPAREIRTAEHGTGDASKLNTSAQIERRVVSGAEQQGTNTATDEQAQAEQAARIQAAIKRANSSLQSIHHTSCQFAYDEKTRRVSITVRDDETNEVIREIPSEEALELIQRMWEMAGLMVDEAR